jgi:hypothetical protein
MSRDASAAGTVAYAPTWGRFHTGCPLTCSCSTSGISAVTECPGGSSSTVALGLTPSTGSLDVTSKAYDLRGQKLSITIVCESTDSVQAAKSASDSYTLSLEDECLKAGITTAKDITPTEYYLNLWTEASFTLPAPHYTDDA